MLKLTMAAWLSIAIRRCTDYLAIFGLVLVYSILQSITAFAELRAVLSHPDRPCIFQALFLGLSLIQLLGSLTARTADHTIQKRLAKRSGISPPELCRPSILSTGYLYYVLPTIRRAAATPGGIEPPLLTPDLATASILTRFRALGQHGPLTRRLLRFLFADWMLQVFWCAVASLMSIGPLFFMRALLNELAKPSDDFDRTKSAILALLIPSFQALKAVFDGLALIKGRHMCVKARAVCSGEIYAKTLRRQDVAKPAGDESSSSAGRISNMVSADVMQVSEVFAYLHFLFPSVPIIVGIDLWLLFDTLGKSAFIGIGVLLFLTPFQFIIGRLYNKLTSRILNASDKRLHLLQEVLHGIKLIRFFAWSESFADRLARLRQTETNLLLRRSLLESALEIVYMSNAALIGILTFYFHTRVFGHTLTSAVRLSSSTGFLRWLI